MKNIFAKFLLILALIYPISVLAQSVPYTATGASGVVYPSSGTVATTSNTLGDFSSTTSAQLLSVMSDETGTGSVVFSASPTFTGSPALATATATTINKVTITAPASSATLTIANGKTLTASNTLTFTGTDSSTIAAGAGGTILYAPVANSSLATMAADTVKGNATGSVATPTDLTLTNLLDIASNTRGSVLERGASGWTIITPGTLGNVLTSNGSGADPTYQAVTGSGTVNAGTSGQLSYYASSTNAVSGNPNLTISAAALTLGVTGSATGSEIFSGATTGAVTIQPQAAAGTYNFNLPITAGAAGTVLTSQGGGSTAMTWTSAGTGTVTGPVSSTSTAIALYNGTGGQTLQNSVVTVDSSGNTAGMGTLASAAHTITSASSGCFAVGANGTSNPAVSIDCSASAVADGISITPTAAGSGVTIGTTSSGTDEILKISSKGAGDLQLTPGSSSGVIRLQNNGATKLSIASSNAAFAPSASSTAATVRFSWVSASDTNLTASTEAPAIYFNAGTTRAHATGALTLQRDFRITPSTHGFVGASTLTNAAALAIDGPPIGGTNATITNSSGLYIPTEALSNTTNGYSMNIAAPSGATNNFAGLITGNLALRSTAPTISSCGSGSLTSGSSNHKGSIGSITTATACTITFSSALDTAPACTFSDSAGTAVGVSSISTSAVTTSMTALTGTLYYICF